MDNLAGNIVINISNAFGSIALVQRNIIILKVLIIIRLILLIYWQYYYTPSSQLTSVIVWSVIQLLFTIVTLAKKCE